MTPSEQIKEKLIKKLYPKHKRRYCSLISGYCFYKNSNSSNSNPSKYSSENFSDDYLQLKKEIVEILGLQERTCKEYESHCHCFH